MKTTRSLLLAFTILGLGACQGLDPFMGNADASVAAAPDMTSYFEQRLADGKRHLRASRPGAAINAFRQSSYHGDYAAEAYNGMAIAYSMIGRADQAQRYFTAAVELAPEDARFFRNLARFEEATPAPPAVQSPAMATSISSGQPEATLSFGNAKTVIAAMEVKPLPERMERISIGQVHITSRNDWQARAASGNSVRRAVVHVGGADERAHLARSTATDKYPMAIRLGELEQRRSAPATQNLQGSRFVAARQGVRVRVSGQLKPHERQTYPIQIALRPSGV